MLKCWFKINLLLYAGQTAAGLYPLFRHQFQTWTSGDFDTAIDLLKMRLKLT